MGRNKWQVGRDGGDTPVKAALGRRQTSHRRLLAGKHCETLPEEPEAEDMIVRPTSAMWTSTKPVHCKSVLRLNRRAHTDNPRNKAVSPATPPTKSGHRVSPAGPSTIHITPDQEALNGGESSGKEESNVTPESISSSSLESDTNFSSDDDDDDEDYYFFASASSSSLPSPEIFRREEFVGTVSTSVKDPNIKNSTLLDVSHAQNIHMQQPPNLSTIVDASTILAEKCEISNNRGPDTETKMQTDSFKSDKASKCKTLAKLTKKKSILCKKKVLFKSPILVEILEAKHTPLTKGTTSYGSEPVQTSSPAEQMRLDAETFRGGKMNSKDDSLHLRVTLKRPVRRSPEKAKFFDFVNDSDRDVFFQMMEKRCLKLRTVPLFPLRAKYCM